MILIRYDHNDDTFEYFCDTEGEVDFLTIQIRSLNSEILENDSFSSESTKHYLNPENTYESFGWIRSDYDIVLKIISTLKDFDFSVELKELD